MEVLRAVLLSLLLLDLMIGVDDDDRYVGADGYKKKRKRV